MSQASLEDVLQRAASPVELLRNSQIGPYAFPVVKSEFTNWRDEQRAWKESCALFDQSHHMTDLYVEGPDALKVLSDLAVNSFKNFKVDQAKQFIACNHDGYVIGDAILFYLEENKLNLVGRPPAANWVQYHVETGGYNAKCVRDARSAENQGRRLTYRFQVQGPHAQKTMEKATGKPAPDIRFFHMDRFTIGGRVVRALRHGMVGQPGWELWGPWEDAEAVRDAIFEAGREFGIRLVGSRAYPTSCLESGWIPSPLPAVYTGDAMKPYRQWLGAASYEAMASLGGSYVSANIAGYYLTPWDLGYGPFVKFDHDFIGRRWPQTRRAPKSRWSGTEPTSKKWSAPCSSAATWASTSTSRWPTTPRSPSIRCCTTASPRACRPTPATPTTSARCYRWASSITNTPSPERRSPSCGASPRAAPPNRRSNAIIRWRSVPPSPRSRMPRWRASPTARSKRD